MPARIAAVLALATLSLAPAGAQPPPHPPIDRKPWMVSSPSQRLRRVKPIGRSADYPNLRDYMRVLERFPLYGERGWRANYLGQPDLGFFGDPDSAEMGLRSMGNFIFVMALLATDPAYDPAVTGVSRETVLKRARSCLAYMTRSHVTGDIVCGDGKRWGDHWQSAWWTSKMALGAQLMWDRLSAGERAAVERVVSHEASRHLGRKAPSGVSGDTKSEENAWDTEVLAVALALFPNRPEAPAWRAKLIEFALNSLSVEQDKTSDRLVDGRPLREQVYTENVHGDFTIENHGAYHTCYMACPLHSLAWGYCALARAGQPVPEAQFHHFRDVWRQMRATFLDRRFAYPEGKDWPRYAYGMVFIMPALVVLADRFGDEAARAIEAARFRALEEEQAENADGSFFGRRFTHNQMMDRLAEYETDCYANLGVSYLLHRLSGRPPSVPIGRAELLRRIADRHVVVSPRRPSWVRTAGLFASFSTQHLSGPFPLAFFIPEGMGDAAEWGFANLLGRIDVEGLRGPRNRVFCNPWGECRPVGAGFIAEWRLVYTRPDTSPAYTHEVRFDVRPENGTAVVESRFVADADVTVTRTEGLRLHVASDRWNKGKRTWRSEGGAQTLAFDLEHLTATPETITTVPFTGPWVNIDDRLGIVQLDAKGPSFVLRRSDRRNAPWGSLHYDVLDCPLEDTTRRTFHKGDVILETAFLLVAGDAPRTRSQAQTVGALRRTAPEPTAGPDGR